MYATCKFCRNMVGGSRCSILIMCTLYRQQKSVSPQKKMIWYGGSIIGKPVLATVFNGSNMFTTSSRR